MAAEGFHCMGRCCKRLCMRTEITRTSIYFGMRLQGNCLGDKGTIDLILSRLVLTSSGAPTWLQVLAARSARKTSCWLLAYQAQSPCPSSCMEKKAGTAVAVERWQDWTRRRSPYYTLFLDVYFFFCFQSFVLTSLQPYSLEVIVVQF